MLESDWYGLYGESWSDLAPGAVSHPAKYSRALIRRIYDYAIERGYVRPGDHVLDPFGGVAGGAADAMRLGLRWTGVELEAVFHEFGLANIAHWNKLYGSVAPGWGAAQFIHGDSRKLVDILTQAADLTISSPPYGEGQTRDRSPYSGGEIGSMMTRAYTQDRQGTTAGNLNTARARAEDLDAVISSPPYEDVIKKGEGPGARWDEKSHSKVNARRVTNKRKYGTAAGQIGEAKGDTFWGMARDVVAATYTVLKPGGVSIWICRDFVRRGKLVPFSDQWLRLCESVGYIPLEYIRSWLVRVIAEHPDLFGGVYVEKKSNKTMFRTLAERNGSPAVDWEGVLILQKPE